MSEPPALASRSPDDGEALAQRRSPPDGGCRAAGGRLCATSGQPPLATMPSNCAIACSVCCTVAGDNVGSDAFGIWMVREPESKPWPKSPALVLVDQRLERRVLAERARGREAAAGERGRLQAAQDGAPARMAVVRRIGHCSPRSPHRLPNLHAGSAFTRSQSAALGKFQHFKSAAWGKDGAGRICDGMPRQMRAQTHQTPGGGNPGGLVAAEDGGEEPRKLQIRADRGSGRSRTARAGAATCSRSRTRRR